MFYRNGRLKAISELRKTVEQYKFFVKNIPKNNIFFKYFTPEILGNDSLYFISDKNRRG